MYAVVTTGCEWTRLIASGQASWRVASTASQYQGFLALCRVHQQNRDMYRHFLRLRSHHVIYSTV